MGRQGLLVLFKRICCALGCSRNKRRLEIGKKWIKSDKERIAAAGWATLANYTRVNEDDDLDIDGYRKLLETVEKEVHTSQNRVRHTMNAFVIAVGTFVSELTDNSMEVANRIGKVHVEMGGTACKVPFAQEYIQKAIDKGIVGKKRKTARC